MCNRATIISPKEERSGENSMNHINSSQASDESSEARYPRRDVSIGAGAVVMYDDRVLLVRNIRGVTRGRYLLPAGRVHAGELPDQTAVRETFGETNLHVQIEGLLGGRLRVMDTGEQNDVIMFQAKL